MDLPNTMAMDDIDSDESSDHPNETDIEVYGYLVRIDHNGALQTPFLLTKETNTIGRMKTNVIVLTNPTISSKHAEIIFDISQHMAYIVDLKSTNHTRTGAVLPSEDHSNKKIKSNRECIIKSGEYVTFGDVHFVFFHDDDYDRYQEQQMSNHSSSASHSTNLLATQAFDDPLPPNGGSSGVTAANTAANRSNKQDIDDLKLSLSDDEQSKQPSPKRVQFVGVKDSQQSNTGNLDPTLEWGDDDDEDNTDGLAATMAFDDDIDDDVNHNGPLAATMAFDDLDETTQEEEEESVPLAATMAFEDDDNTGNELAATMAFEDEFASDHENHKNESLNDTSELLATMAIEDDDDDALPATMAIEDDPLPATMAIDDDDTELAATMAIEDALLPATVAMDDDVDPLPATMAIEEDDHDREDVLPATVAIDDDVDPLPATMAIEEDDHDREDVLPATVAIDDDVDPLPMAIADDDHGEEEDVGALPDTVAMDDDNDDDVLPATMAIDDDDDEIHNGEVLEATMVMDEIMLSGSSTVNSENNNNPLPATMAIEDPDETQDEEEEDAPLPATMAIADTEEDVTEDEASALPATMAIEEDTADILQSEKRLALDATLAVMTDDEEEAKEQPLSATVKIDTDDIDLEDTVDSNTNNTDDTSPVKVPVQEPKEATPQPVMSSARHSRRPRRRATKTPPQSPRVEPIRRSTRIARRNSVADEDGDVKMNKPVRKSRRSQKKKTKNVSSLDSLLVNRANRNETAQKRGRKRNLRDREKEEEESNNADGEERIEPPPAKRPRRGRVAKRSTKASNTNNGLRRSTRRTNKRLDECSSEEDNDAGVVVLRTGTDCPSEKKKLEALGAVVLSEYDDSVTHIVSRQPRRTLKFISGLATAKYIVTDAWCTQCIKKRTLKVDESRYFPHNKATRDFEKEYGFKLNESFTRLQERSEALFDGYKVYFTKNIKSNVKKAIGTMAQSHGAAVVTRAPKALRSGQEADPMVIVIGENVNHKYCKNIAKKGYTVYNRDVIITTILRQQIDLEDEDFYLT
eukprot:660706_1